MGQTTTKICGSVNIFMTPENMEVKCMSSDCKKTSKMANTTCVALRLSNRTLSKFVYDYLHLYMHNIQIVHDLNIKVYAIVFVSKS